MLDIDNAVDRTTLLRIIETKADIERLQAEATAHERKSRADADRLQAEAAAHERKAKADAEKTVAESRVAAESHERRVNADAQAEVMKLQAAMRPVNRSLPPVKRNECGVDSANVCHPSLIMQTALPSPSSQLAIESNQSNRKRRCLKQVCARALCAIYVCPPL